MRYLGKYLGEDNGDEGIKGIKKGIRQRWMGKNGESRGKKMREREMRREVIRRRRLGDGLGQGNPLESEA